MTIVHPDWTEDDGPLPGDRQVLSASSLSNVLAKPQLEDWRAREGAARINEEWEMLTALRQTDPEGAERWMRDAAFHATRGRLNARDRGTIIHQTFESWFNGKPLPSEYVAEELYPHLEHLAKWVEDTGYRPSHQERVVWGDKVGGRLDQCGSGPNLPDGLGLIDLKTVADDLDGGGRKRRPYPIEICLQMSSYFYAEHMATHEPRVMSKGRNRIYLFSEEEELIAEPAPTFDWCAVLLITPARAELYPVNMEPKHYAAAEHAAGVYWHSSSVKGYLGKSLGESRAT